MSNIIRYTSTLIFLLLIGCSHDNNSQIPQGEEFFVPKDYAVISDPPEAYPQMLQSLFYLDSTGVLFSVYSIKQKSILVYDLLKDSLAAQIDLEDVLLNSSSEFSNRISGYYIHNWDSIFIITFFSNELFLINGQSEILHHIAIPYQRKDSLLYNIIGYENFPFYKDGTIYTRQNFKSHYYASDKEENLIYYNTPIEVAINFSNGEIVETNMLYPEFYRQGNFYDDLTPTRAINMEKAIRYFTFGFHDSIIVVQPNGDIRRVFAPSAYLEQPPVYIGDSAANHAYTEGYRMRNSKSLALYFDPFQNLFYRVIKHGANEINEDGFKAVPGDEPMSIVVMDTSFRLIYEHVFPSKMLLSYMKGIVSDRGFYYMLHWEHPKYEEGKWNFVLLKPKRHGEL